MIPPVASLEAPLPPPSPPSPPSDSPQKAPGRLLEVPRSSQKLPRKLLEGPRSFQKAPRSPEAPRCFQKASRRLLQGPRSSHQKHPQAPCHKLPGRRRVRASELRKAFCAATVKPGACRSFVRSPFTGFSAPVTSVYKPLRRRSMTCRKPSPISSLPSKRLPPWPFGSGTAYM